MLSVNLQLSADTCELICEDLKSTIMIKRKKQTQNWAVEVVGQQEGSGPGAARLMMTAWSPFSIRV